MLHIYLCGTVDKDMAEQVFEALQNSLSENVAVNITSEGGDPDIAIAIVSMLRVSGRHLHTIVHGQCYSAATLIFAAGQRRSMDKNALAMVHEASESVDGTASTIKQCAKRMEREEARWNALMQELTGTDAKVWEKLSERDTYLDAQECLKLNLCTDIF